MGGEIEPSAEVRTAARFFSEWFVALRDAGMGRRDALDLIATLARERMSGGDTPTEGDER